MPLAEMFSTTAAASAIARNHAPLVKRMNGIFDDMRRAFERGDNAAYGVLDGDYHQAMIESLYYLNYQTGESMPWLAAGPEQWNEDFTEVVIPLREGVEWSDGTKFTAGDVAFTLEILKANPTLGYGATMEQWVEEVTAVDDLTVRLKLNEPNPRFIYSNFAVRIWGAVRILPD